jgi:hypothetical protein
MVSSKRESSKRLFCLIISVKHLGDRKLCSSHKETRLIKFRDIMAKMRQKGHIRSSFTWLDIILYAPGWRLALFFVGDERGKWCNFPSPQNIVREFRVVLNTRLFKYDLLKLQGWLRRFQRALEYLTPSRRQSFEITSKLNVVTEGLDLLSSAAILNPECTALNVRAQIISHHLYNT